MRTVALLMAAQAYVVQSKAYRITLRCVTERDIDTQLDNFHSHGLCMLFRTLRASFLMVKTGRLCMDRWSSALLWTLATRQQCLALQGYCIK